MAKRRRRGDGSIYKTASGYRAQATVNGESISVSGKKYSDVKEELDRRMLAAKTRNCKFNKDITVNEFAPVWLENRAKKSMQEQSYLRLEAMFNNKLLPVFGEFKLTDLNTALIEQKYAEMFIGYKTHGKIKEYSHTTVNAYATQFKKMLSYAVQCDILDKNPHMGVELHKLRPPKKVKAYSKEDGQKIAEYARANRLYWIFYLLISTGIRFGEASCLTWDDVDLKNKTIKISKTLVEMHGHATVKESPKTNAGNREISISPKLNSWLKMIYMQLDNDLNYRNLVIPNLRYGFNCSANMTKRFKKLCKAVGIEYQGKHSLRHTWATRALEAGVDVKTVSRMLGHKNVVTTMNIYQDVLKEHQDDAIEKISEIVDY